MPRAQVDQAVLLVFACEAVGAGAVSGGGGGHDSIGVIRPRKGDGAAIDTVDHVPTMTLNLANSILT